MSADSYGYFDMLRKAAGVDTPPSTADLATLASGNAIATAIRDLERQLVTSTEALAEVLWDFLDDAYGDGLDEEFDVTEEDGEEEDGR